MYWADWKTNTQQLLFKNKETHTTKKQPGVMLEKSHFVQLLLTYFLYFWSFRHDPFSLDILCSSMQVTRATYVTMPWSMIPPNRTAVVWSSRSGYCGKKRYSSNKFLSMHWNTSWRKKNKTSIHICLYRHTTIQLTEAITTLHHPGRWAVTIFNSKIMYAFKSIQLTQTHRKNEPLL